MPVIVKDYVWRQSNEIISIHVPLKGVHSSKVDILISEKYVKLHFPPFLFEVFLFRLINESKGECTFTDTEAILELVKAESALWEHLEAILNKQDKMLIKHEVINDIQLKTRKYLDERISQRITLDRFAVSEAMQFDTKRREKIDACRDLERKNAMDDFESWKKNVNSPCEPEDRLTKPINYQNRVKIRELSINEEPITSDKKVPKKQNSHLIKDIKSLKDTNNTTSNKMQKCSNFYTNVKSDIETQSLPAPRKAGILNVSFTQRIFPTPSRESSAHDEEVWMKNLNEARRAIGFVSEDLRPEEQDPQWCKDKGDDFYKNGNYLGAISAYSHGIKLSDKLPSLFSNRAVSHFAMGNFKKCIEDCSSALDLLKPQCQANLESRVRCITRRAAALTRIGMLGRGIDEMNAAIKLQPFNEKLKSDLHNMERAWEQNPDSD